jgi:hypothetical protein
MKSRLFNLDREPNQSIVARANCSHYSIHVAEGGGMRMAPVSWRTLRCVFELEGFAFKKGKGSHWVGVKIGVARPLVIPEYSEIGLDIIRSNLRTAGISRERYFELLKKC